MAQSPDGQYAAHGGRARLQGVHELEAGRCQVKQGGNDREESYGHELGGAAPARVYCGRFTDLRLRCNCAVPRSNPQSGRGPETSSPRNRTIGRYMFQNLSERLTQSLRSITGKSKITEDNIQGTLREVRMALLEADVALPVVKQFVEAVKTARLGQEVMSSLSPARRSSRSSRTSSKRSWVRANEGAGPRRAAAGRDSARRAAGLG
jgi:signal recognition particle GTPase